jgi:hypothetical protein
MTNEQKIDDFISQWGLSVGFKKGTSINHILNEMCLSEFHYNLNGEANPAYDFLCRAYGYFWGKYNHVEASLLTSLFSAKLKSKHKTIFGLQKI